ncbi:hypothetical protein ACTXG6_02680 [Pseudonocardia sp. Cha107L01]|uniref:hypothetical protein n=1 Tax=Pseudonocardia sp. Cha107L01 TaxID=3457576 RepID=UPI00403E6F06
MSQLRAPRLAGVGGGVGTTTLATALRGYDRGRAADQGVEVLVARSTGGSLHQAATVIAWLASNSRPRPVLAVVADQPAPIRGPLRARLRMIEPQVSALVVVPYVVHWRELTDPLREAARLSECPADQLPKALRGYGEALAGLAEAVLRSGLLTGARPGGPHTPPPANRTTGPIGRTLPTRALPDRTLPNQAVPNQAVAANTGAYPAVGSTGPHAALLGTGPHAAVTGTGAYPAVTSTGPHTAVDRSLAPAAAPGGR